MRTPATRQARRNAYLVDHLYRSQCGGTGDREEVASDVISDMLLGLPDGEWLYVLRNALTSAYEERYGHRTAEHLELAPIGLAHYPEGW